MAFNEETWARVKAYFDYDPKTGLFSHGGWHCGSKLRSGYVRLTMGRGNFEEAHRVAWFIVYNKIPVRIDHINGVRHDNWIANLREATNSLNMHNRPNLHPSNISGATGVTWNARLGKWQARICCNYVERHLGLFSSVEDAARVVEQERSKWLLTQKHS